jgi:hypothetical protein
MGHKSFNYRFPLIKLKAKQVLKRQMLHGLETTERILKKQEERRRRQRV